MLTKRTVLVFLATVAVTVSATVARAAPVNPKDIATDSAMLFHLDWDAIQASTIGQSVLSEPAVQEKLETVEALFDIDLTNQLHGITFYTTAAHAKDGVVLISADFEPEHLLAKAQSLNDFLPATNGSHVIYSWLDEKWKRREGETARAYGAISGHYVVYGQTEARLAEAIDVLEGTAHGGGAEKEPLFTKPGERILIEGMLLKMDFPNAQGPGAILQQCKSAYLKVSEANSNTTAALRLETADDKTATQLNSIIQGLVGMLKLQGGDTNALKFANSINVTTDDLDVRVTVSMSSSDMFDLIKSGQEKAAKRGNRRARDKVKGKDKDKDSQPNNN